MAFFPYEVIIILSLQCSRDRESTRVRARELVADYETHLNTLSNFSVHFEEEVK